MYESLEVGIGLPDEPDPHVCGVSSADLKARGSPALDVDVSLDSEVADHRLARSSASICASSCRSTAARASRTERFAPVVIFGGSEVGRGES